MHLIGGVGSGHSSDTHHVTGCMHGHAHFHEGNLKTGGGDAGSQMSQMQMEKQQQDAEFSLSSWLQKILRGGKSILKGIWGTNDTNTEGVHGDKDGSARTMAQRMTAGQRPGIERKMPKGWLNRARPCRGIPTFPRWRREILI